MPLEISKTQKAHDLGRMSGLFRVPRVVDRDDERGQIAYEHIANLAPLCAFMGDEGKIVDLVGRAGKNLALIQQELVLSPEERVECEGGGLNFGSERQQAFLHGDYNLLNLQYDPVGDQLVILDWSLTSYLGQEANWGPIYWDLGWMVKSILTIPPYLWSQGKLRARMADVFLTNYNMLSDTEMVWNNFSIYTQRIMEMYGGRIRRTQDWYLYLNLVKSSYHYNGYLKNLMEKLQEPGNLNEP